MALLCKGNPVGKAICSRTGRRRFFARETRSARQSALCPGGLQGSRCAVTVCGAVAVGKVPGHLKPNGRLKERGAPRPAEQNSGIAVGAPALGETLSRRAKLGVSCGVKVPVGYG